ncbi:hypothetical protein KVT40_003583 [Elsinoe batatas]|uniref:Nucleoside phosphorylase domain-containing protein n=1 Tax=Elsinoe batatas TaxID=2601811 RepID=A0A8K0L2F9_9PEZI|nr:hypothetical protein KVT40_003583 [Elsinoe batatas]
MSKAADYHVGWICALATELTAARDMLDQKYDKLGRLPGDDNSYTYGRIGEHNVVIACLPAGVYGTNSASHVAGNMMRSFPSLRFGLMVGVGGGVPSRRNDIRLGDVVVSKPIDQSSGVIQYDMGRVRPGGMFQPTGSLNRPPTVLLNAVNDLASEHESSGSQIVHILQQATANNPRRRRACTYPNPPRDFLFQHTSQHVGEEGDCSDCDANELVQRPNRDDTEPVIHYGIIASANQVVRDGVARERLRRDLNAMCLEMEASGLMDNFPCLVIRGICDYADSHKNKDWQPYAAATAAAYAKELLGVIAPEQVDEIPAAGGGGGGQPAEGNGRGGSRFIFNNHGSVGNQVGEQTNNGPMYFGTVNNHKLPGPPQ